MSAFYRDLSWLARPPANFQSVCRGLRMEPVTWSTGVRALAATSLDENQLLSLARLVKSAEAEDPSLLSGLTRFRLNYISNSTPDFIIPAIVGTALRYGIALQCAACSFEQAFQDASNEHSPLNSPAADAVLIAVDWRSLAMRESLGKVSEAMVSASLGRIQAMCDKLTAGSKAVCIVQNFAPPAERVLGSLDRTLNGTPCNTVDQFNRALGEMAKAAGHVLLDITGLAETVGLANWHSAAEWNLAKLPFAQSFVPLYADYACRTIAAVRGRSRRCLVLDLDNTLWGGVVADDGLNGIAIAQGDATGEAFLDFQRYILTLRQAGIALAVCSKNEDERARLPFRLHPEMLIRESDIAVFQANWHDKPTNLKAIANELSLGLESLVFVDDNPFERELVRKILPQVAVPEMPSDPALYAMTLSAAGYFEAISFSGEDANRASYYEGNAKRAMLHGQVCDLNSYLVSLEMEISFQPFDAIGRSRIAQLINKSNQFNLTTRRYTEAQVAVMESSPEFFTRQVRLRDIFGDNGMISVVICRIISDTQWEIDTWLMSCRVLGRRVENMVLREILQQAAANGVKQLRGIYLPTDRNKLVEQHYANLGFSLEKQFPDGSNSWQMAVEGAHVEAAPMTVLTESPVIL